MIPAWSAAIAAIALRARLGCVPQSPAAAGLGWGGVVLAGGGVFIAGAEWEARRPARLTLRSSSTPPARPTCSATQWPGGTSEIARLRSEILH